MYKKPNFLYFSIMNWISISFSQLLCGRHLISGNPRPSLLFSLGFHLNSRQAYRPLVLNLLSGLVSAEMPCLPAAGFSRALLYSLCVCVCAQSLTVVLPGVHLPIPIWHQAHRACLAGGAGDLDLSGACLLFHAACRTGLLLPLPTLRVWGHGPGVW